MQQTLFEDADNSHENIALPNAELRYIPHFLDNHQSYYQELMHTLNWRQDSINFSGNVQSVPRLNAWYSDDTQAYSYSGLRFKPQYWTAALLQIKKRVEFICNKRFNSALVNWYRNGDDSVAWHSDDEPELGDQPIIASISLGHDRLFVFREKADKKRKYSMTLAGGSLLLMSGKTQAYWEHSLPKDSSIHGRINLTFRQVS